MTQPHEHSQHEDEPNNPRPGQYDEGGHGGMATRELDAEKADTQPDD